MWTIKQTSISHKFDLFLFILATLYHNFVKFLRQQLTNKIRRFIISVLAHKQNLISGVPENNSEDCRTEKNKLCLCSLFQLGGKIKMRIGNKMFETKGRTYIMGILNVTPDSFSDGGKYCFAEKAFMHACKMVEEGADVIDIGGESTRPGYTRISDAEEIRRVLPVIELIKKNLDVPISVDTYKPAVAAAAIEAGADLINDIWGLQQEGMASIIAEAGTPCCLMHNRENGNLYVPDIRSAMLNDMQELLARAAAAGITRDKIILDPGIGFAKTTLQNLQVLNDVNFMMPPGYPLLLGASRKSVIGNTLNVPVGERLAGTLATTVLAVQKGCMFVRVHDVLENAKCIKMVEAITNAVVNV